MANYRKKFKKRKLALGGEKEKLPVNSEGLPVVNLPEFEVVGPRKRNNDYSPTDGREFFSDLGEGILDFFIPSAEKQQTYYDPNTGEPLPASGKVNPAYPEAALIGVKPNLLNKAENTANKLTNKLTNKINNVIEQSNYNPQNLKSQSGLDWMNKWYSDPDLKKRFGTEPVDPYTVISESRQESILRKLNKYKPKNYINLLEDKGAKKYLTYSPTTGGVSYGHPDGIYINRTMSFPFNKKKLESIRTHELTHLIENNGGMLSDSHNEQLLKPFGISSIDEIPKGRASEYYLDPTEIHARMNQARFDLDLNPKDEFTEKMFDEISNKKDWYGMNNYIKDKKEFINLMNKFWAAPPAIVGAAAAATTENQEYATGGKIMSKYKKLKKRKLAAGGPTDYSAVYGGLDAAGSAVGVPGLGQLVKLQDGLDAKVGTGIRNNIQKNSGLTDEQADVVFQGSNKVGDIPLIGGKLGMAVDTFNAVTGKTKSRLKDFRQQQTIAQGNASPSYDIRYALGGSLNEINGPAHEEGGVDQAPSIETEGGETQKDDYIFSDRLKYPGKKTTFAKLSKKIRDKYTGKRPNDKISKEAEERELATLADVQEIVRGEVMESAVQMAYGGSMKKKMYGGGNIPNDPDNILSKLERRYETENRYGYINERASIPNLSQYTQPTDLKIYPNIEPELNIGIDRLPTTEIPTMDIPGLTISPQTTNPIKPVPSKDFGVEGLDASGNAVSYNPDLFPDTNSSYNPENFMGADEFANTKTQLSGDNINKSNFGGADGLDYASMGLQVANAAFDLYQNRKIDPVNYKRAKPTMVDNYKAKILANQEANRGLSAGQASINQTGDTASRTLSNARALAIKGAQNKAETTAGIMQNEELQNVGIKNTFEQANTQIANLEKDAYAQNKAQVFNNRSTALNNLTKQLTGSVGTVKKYEAQQMITKLVGTDNWKLEGDKIVTYNDNGEKVSSFSLTQT